MTDRSAILLRFYERKSFAEVGEALGMQEEAARKRVSRATEKLRLIMRQRGPRDRGRKRRRNGQSAQRQKAADGS